MNADHPDTAPANSLTGARVLVFGATGNVGYGAALAFLDAGARVIAPTRSARGVDSLREAFSGRALSPVLGDISDPNDALRLRDEIVGEHGPINHVFAALGPWWQGGAVQRQTPAEWARVRAMLLDGHVHAASLFLSELRATRAGAEQPSYTVVTGMGAHHYLPETSLLFVATNGVLGLSRVLRHEHARGPTRVNELLIGCRVEREPRPGVVASAVFGRAATELALGVARGEVFRYDGPERFGP